MHHPTHYWPHHSFIHSFIHSHYTASLPPHCTLLTPYLYSSASLPLCLSAIACLSVCLSVCLSTWSGLQLTVEWAEPSLS
jgi:hypothetical protein